MNFVRSADRSRNWLGRWRPQLKAVLVALAFTLPLVSQGSEVGTPSEKDQRDSGELFRRHVVSVGPLDLSRAPTTDDLMAAGQLGGVLYPTHELKDKARDEAARSDFGRAIEEWNKHEYPKALQLFKNHVLQLPDSPWAAEAMLHVGCDATYNGRYTEAEAIFSQLISANLGKDHPGAKMMLNKARQRLALVKVEENNLDEASSLFRDLESESPDWKQRTYAAHWLQRLSHYAAARQALVNCGANALAYVLEKEGNAAAAARVRLQIPQTMRGHSLADLVKMAESEGHQATAIFVTPAELAQVHLPAVLHISEGSSGDKGHYWVLDKMQGEQLELFDPQSHRRFHQTLGQLTLQWSGKVLVFSRTGKSIGRELDLQEMSEAIGGCCGVPAAPSNLGNDPRNNNPGGPNGSSCGAPIWSVNMINMNFYAVDTPMWFDPAIGPSVKMMLSYNSQSSIAHYEPFGSKWTFAYGGYLVMDTSGTVTVFMPDGRMDVYTPNGGGGFTSPYRVYSTLNLISANHYELNFPDGSVYVYSIPAGTSSQQPFLTAIRDAYGNTLRLIYNSSVQLTTITDAQGDVFTLGYNSSGLVTNIADPFERSTTFQYDGNKNLIQITDLGGYWSTMTYDTNVFISSIGDDRGTWIFRTEPADGIDNGSNPYPPPGTAMFGNYRITATNPLGQSEEFQYDGYSSYAWHVRPRDYLPWQSQFHNSYILNVPRTRYDYTRLGSYGEFSQITYSEGDYIRYGYNNVTGDRTSVADTQGHTWRYTYNSMGKVTSVTDAKGTPSALTYSTNGLDLVAVSNGLGTIRLVYNAQHDLVALTDRLTNTTTFTYNTNGQILSQGDALGITNEWFYDDDQRLGEFRRVGQTLERFTSDAVGRVRTRTDASGLIVTNDYNALNQVVRVTWPDAGFESYAYSTCCPRLLDSVTDRGGRTTVFIYDALKRLIQTVNPEGGITQFGYDANGNRTSLTDPNGNVTTFAYDLDNRLVRKTYADGKSVSFGYGADGLLTTRTNARGIATTYAYDANHNLLTTSYADDTPGVTNSYDAFNRISVVTDVVGTNAYAYDANSRVTSFDGPWADDAITYGYDALGRRTNLLVQGSQPTGYDYDALTRLQGVRVGAQAYAYTYAGASPLVQRLDRPNGSYTTYQYDDLNRLTDIANKQSTGQVINEFAYTYNAQDMRDSETISNGLPVILATNQLVTYNYNQLNQVLTSAPPGHVFSFDKDGNMIRAYTPDGYVFSAAYDADSRLKSLVYSNDNGVVFSNQYIYRWTGFLSEMKQFQNGILTNDTRFVRAGYFPLQERDSNNNVVREYAWDLRKRGGIGGLLDLKDGGQSYSYVYDGRGNVAAVLDASQNTAASYAYDPFGLLLGTSGALNQPFGFSSKPYDSLTGLSHFGFRLYAPALGRWLNRDPIAEVGGINLYAYVGDNPLGRNDFYGLDAGTGGGSAITGCSGNGGNFPGGNSGPGSAPYTPPLEPSTGPMAGPSAGQGNNGNGEGSGAGNNSPSGRDWAELVEDAWPFLEMALKIVTEDVATPLGLSVLRERDLMGPWGGT